MSEKLEAMWIVERYDNDTQRITYKIFRTRNAARKYHSDMDLKQKASRYLYAVRRATWGPEQ